MVSRSNSVATGGVADRPNSLMYGLGRGIRANSVSLILELVPLCRDVNKDLTPKDQDKDKDLKYVLKESLRTRTRTTARQIILIVTTLVPDGRLFNCLFP